MFRQLGPAELTIILLIVVLLFGAKKLPETARGLGRSMRIFKAETKGLRDDDDDLETRPAPPPREVERGPSGEVGAAGTESDRTGSDRTDSDRTERTER